MLPSPSKLLLHTPRTVRCHCLPAGGGTWAERGGRRAPPPCGQLWSPSQGCKATCPGTAAPQSSGHHSQESGTLTSASSGWSYVRGAAPGQRPLQERVRQGDSQAIFWKLKNFIQWRLNNTITSKFSANRHQLNSKTWNTQTEAFPQTKILSLTIKARENFPRAASRPLFPTFSPFVVFL